jgi:N-acetyl-anhydromuramyl-L-alanine amidase AmpD
MRIITDKRSPNFTDTVIPVEYVVVHYTATTLERTLEIFMAPDRASAHLVIDRSGDVYELVPCLDGAARRAWHAGKSRYSTADGDTKEGFNDFSIGIELVNLKGNVFPYSEHQYRSLVAVLNKLKVAFPTLADPERIVGHEHIAGFRGKSDPGRCFSWNRVFRDVYSDAAPPPRPFVCSVEEADAIHNVMQSLGVRLDPSGEVALPVNLKAEFFESLSSLAETAMRSKSNT